VGFPLLPAIWLYRGLSLYNRKSFSTSVCICTTCQGSSSWTWHCLAILILSARWFQSIPLQSTILPSWTWRPFPQRFPAADVPYKILQILRLWYNLTYCSTWSRL